MTSITGTNSISLLGAAHTALRTAVAGIPADGWDLPTPCEHWTVTQVLQHATGDQVGYAAAITGGPWPSEDPFQPSGRIDGDAAALLEQALALSAAAFATVHADAEQVPVPLPQGPLPLWVAAGACALDAAVHAWDIAVATGRPSPLTAPDAEQLLAVAKQIVEPLRAYGAYAAELTVAADADADATTVLLAYLGRRPEWTPQS
ncbi:TIGR03086 family metal-binding protein [Catellatospora sichuanensis]|uniref:TIGR03086 family metal-binding protein n=1 Tax=Catellatospora sichuanensis TaxID=1969805 RepID=UPI001182360F|nr:TIGR03086 family metal-binding protein [Catellatospora sichuanensis]